MKLIVPFADGFEEIEAFSVMSVLRGAGLDVDGQVLVLHDLLGFNQDFSPRFVRQFANGEKWMQEAVTDYSSSVESKAFPRLEESFQ